MKKQTGFTKEMNDAWSNVKNLNFKLRYSLAVGYKRKKKPVTAEQDQNLKAAMDFFLCYVFNVN